MSLNMQNEIYFISSHTRSRSVSAMRFSLSQVQDTGENKQVQDTGENKQSTPFVPAREIGALLFQDGRRNASELGFGLNSTCYTVS